MEIEQVQGKLFVIVESLINVVETYFKFTNNLIQKTDLWCIHILLPESQNKCVWMSMDAYVQMRVCVGMHVHAHTHTHKYKVPVYVHVVQILIGNFF